MGWPIRFECPKCGGDNCGYDAYSVWDTVEQDWVLGDSYDNGWCSDCGDVEPQVVSLTRAEAADVRQQRAARPEVRLTAALKEAEAAIALAIERLELNDCEGEERPYIRELRAYRRSIRAVRLGR